MKRFSQLLSIFLLVLLSLHFFSITREAFIGEIRGFKNRNKRRIRRAFKDGFTQMKSFFPQKYFFQ